jgi:hypothetical protein
VNSRDPDTIAGNVDSVDSVDGTDGETPAPLAGVRCSDAERERTSSLIHIAAGEGRLSLAEVDERLALIYDARYRHELDALTADLPPAEATTAGWSRVMTGVRRQLVDDVSALFGRQAGLMTRRRMVIALAVLFFLSSLVILAVHGITSDGPEHYQPG